MVKPNAFAASAKRLTMYCSASWVWARSAQSSANSSSTISTSMVLVCARRRRRLKILPSVLKRMKIPSTKSSFASRNIKVKRMENKVGTRTHPCLTPFAIGKLSERAPLCLTWPIWPSCSWRRMVRNFGGQPRRARIFHRPSLLTVSKSLVRSMAENGEELWRAAKTRQDFPQTLPAHCIKGLGQVDGREWWGTLEGSQDAPGFSTDPPCSLYQRPWSGRWQRMVRNFGGQPRRARIFHRPSLLTVSKSLVRSMAENGEELWRAAKTRQDFPQTLPAHCIKGLGQVDGREWWGTLEGSQDAPGFSTDPPCSLYQRPWSGRWQRMVRNFGGQPRRARSFHRPSLLTVSKALVRSMAENGEELWRAAKTRQDFPQTLPAYCIKGLGQVDGGEWWGTLEGSQDAPGFSTDPPCSLYQSPWSGRWQRMVRNFGGQPRRARIFHRPSLLTVSKALVRSMAENGEELWRAAKTRQDFPQTLPAHCIKVLGQVDGREWWGTLEGSQDAPGFSTDPPCSLYQSPWSGRWQRMVRNFGGQPRRARSFHRPSLLAVSKSLVRSMKATNKPMFCSRHFSWIWRSTKTKSVVPLLARKPHWLSGAFSSAMVGISLLSRRRAKTLLAMESRVMPL